MSGIKKSNPSAGGKKPSKPGPKSKPGAQNTKGNNPYPHDNKG